jgi:hypothetical protein
VTISLNISSFFLRISYSVVFFLLVPPDISSYQNKPVFSQFMLRLEGFQVSYTKDIPLLGFFISGVHPASLAGLGELSLN